jgi:hypothetical protein
MTVFLLFLFASVFAIQRTALGGLWSSPASFCPNGVPEDQDDVVVPKGVALTLDVSSKRVKNIVIENGGTLRVQDGVANVSKQLTCRSILVFGVFEIGTIDKPFVSKLKILTTMCRCRERTMTRTK